MLWLDVEVIKKIGRFSWQSLSDLLDCPMSTLRYSVSCVRSLRYRYSFDRFCMPMGDDFVNFLRFGEIEYLRGLAFCGDESAKWLLDHGRLLTNGNNCAGYKFFNDLAMRIAPVKDYDSKYYGCDLSIILREYDQKYRIYAANALNVDQSGEGLLKSEC